MFTNKHFTPSHIIIIAYSSTRKNINYRAASEDIDGELNIIYKENNKPPLLSKNNEISKRVDDKDKGRDIYRIDLDNNIN